MRHPSGCCALYFNLCEVAEKFAADIVHDLSICLTCPSPVVRCGYQAVRNALANGRSALPCSQTALQSESDPSLRIAEAIDCSDLDAVVTSLDVRGR